MNKQEMIEVDGGIIPAVVWLIIEVVSVVGTCVGTYYAARAFYNQETGAVEYSTKEYRLFNNMCADSVKIDSKGNMIFYNPEWH